MLIYVFRHAETDDLAREICTGQGASDLSRHGVTQAIMQRQLIRLIRPKYAGSSHLPRAVSTAKIATQGVIPQKDLNVDERIAEIGLGTWEGKTYEEIRVLLEAHDLPTDLIPCDYRYMDAEERTRMAELFGFETTENIGKRARSHSGTIRYIAEADPSASLALWGHAAMNDYYIEELLYGTTGENLLSPYYVADRTHRDVSVLGQGHTEVSVLDMRRDGSIRRRMIRKSIVTLLSEFSAGSVQSLIPVPAHT